MNVIFSIEFEAARSVSPAVSQLAALTNDTHMTIRIGGLRTPCPPPTAHRRTRIELPSRGDSPFKFAATCRTGFDPADAKRYIIDHWQRKIVIRRLEAANF
jgi:hypothetical protein